MRPHPCQLELHPRTWGGRRSGAGRKPSGRRVGVAHRTRPVHVARHPVHVTLRARRMLPSLRDERIFPAVRQALARASRKGLRLLEFSVQSDHVHLLVEAEDQDALSRGLLGLSIRIARAVNRVLGTPGRVWADRYHARALGTPREVRNGLVYVLQNWRKHSPAASGLDPCSSAAWFAGFRAPGSMGPAPSPVVPPRTWLAAVGWRRLGLIGVDEGPAALRPRRRSRPRGMEAAC